MGDGIDARDGRKQTHDDYQNKQTARKKKQEGLHIRTYGDEPITTNNVDHHSGEERMVGVSPA
ncbi:hypothetical protein N9140_00725 [bacterium]|nr:hypothetical protein [bacterium]